MTAAHLPPDLLLPLGEPPRLRRLATLMAILIRRIREATNAQTEVSHEPEDSPNASATASLRVPPTVVTGPSRKQPRKHRAPIRVGR